MHIFIYTATIKFVPGAPNWKLLKIYNGLQDYAIKSNNAESIIRIFNF
jgi:hypothetical protein